MCPCIGIPGTIDNDIGCTEYTIGFDSASNTAIQCIDKLRDTMQSHERISVVEVMGRRAGHLALNVGCAVGAAAVLVPEHEGNFEHDVIEKIRRSRINGRHHHIIIVSEGYSMTTQEVADRVQGGDWYGYPRNDPWPYSAGRIPHSPGPYYSNSNGQLCGACSDGRQRKSASSLCSTVKSWILK